MRNLGISAARAVLEDGHLRLHVSAALALALLGLAPLGYGHKALFSWLGSVELDVFESAPGACSPIWNALALSLIQICTATGAEAATRLGADDVGGDPQDQLLAKCGQEVERSAGGKRIDFAAEIRLFLSGERLIEEIHRIAHMERQRAEAPSAFPLQRRLDFSPYQHALADVASFQLHSQGGLEGETRILPNRVGGGDFLPNPNHSPGNRRQAQNQHKHEE